VAVALLAPADVPVDDLTLVQPDLFVVPLVEGRPPQEWSEAGHMLLVCEVLSPSSARHDRVVKRIKYQALGVEYWIFDLDGSRVERWLPDATLAEIVTDVLVWTAPGAREPLRIDLPLLFGRLA
jgi:Uma2 family endonuclease